MTKPEDIPTIREILEDADISFFLSENEFEQLVSILEDRENRMVTEIGPRFIYAKGLDKIINQS